MSELPAFLRPLFWDADFAALSWERDRDFIAVRILAAGEWTAVQWLRRELGDDGIRALIERRGGRGLSPQQLRFWEIVLDLPHEQVTPWVGRAKEGTWAQRVTP